MELADILALTNKLPGEQKELKDNLEKSLKELNQDKGQALSDLNMYKQEVSSLKQQNKELGDSNATYNELLKAMNDLGVDVKEADKLAEKLKIKKSADEEVDSMKRLLDEQAGKLKEFEKQAKSMEIKEAIEPALDKALKEYKDKDGKEVQIAQDFIDRKELYKDIDVGSETLVNDRITKVLETAHVKQSNFLESNGLDFVQKVHDVKSGDRHYSGNRGLDRNKLITNVTEKHGHVDAVAEGFAAIIQEEKNQN